MEISRRKIVLGDYINRESNKALFYPYGELVYSAMTPTPDITNYGGFCCNVSICGTTYSYFDAFMAYASVRKQLDTALYLTKITRPIPNCTDGGMYAPDQDLMPNWYNSVANFINVGEGTELYEVLKSYTFVEKSEVVRDVNNTYIYTGPLSGQTSLIAIDNIPEYFDIYLRMADGSIYSEESAEPEAPVLSVPVLLTQDYTKNGPVRVINYNLDENGNLVEVTLPNDIAGLTYTDNCRVESKLKTLMVDDVVIDEETNEPTGFRLILTGQQKVVKVTYMGTDSSDTYFRLTADDSVSGDVDTYWTTATTSISQNGYVVTDDIFAVLNQGTKYTMASLLESAMSKMKQAGISVGDYCNFLILNDKTDIPYIEGLTFNKSVININGDYKADFVDEIEVDDSGETITFTYVIGGDFAITPNDTGGTYVDGSGIRYTEAYPYYPESVEFITIDGCSGVPVTYDKIDYAGASIEVYNPWLRRSRTAIVTDRLSFAGNDVWIGEPAHPVATDDKYSSLIFGPKITANIEFNRGNATAFERHFKLSECNTVADIDSYGNNSYFNT